MDGLILGLNDSPSDGFEDGSEDGDSDGFVLSKLLGFKAHLIVLMIDQMVVLKKVHVMVPIMDDRW